jgi:hypothetical protein
MASAFDVHDLELEFGELAEPTRPPLHVEVFNHVLTRSNKTAFEAEVELPPASWAFGRVILTLQIHDAGPAWDEWDRNGFVSLWDDEGRKHTIVPFITSYRTTCFWQVDVTAFRPWLAGKRRMEVAAGTTFYKRRGFMMSVDLDYYHGTPALEPFAIEPLWEGTAHHGSPENHFADFFAPVRVDVPPATHAAEVVTFVTGHSQVGEFTPSSRRLLVLPDADVVANELAFESRLWKADCYLNPNRPQGGTWKYERAGWAPGDVVAPWVVELEGNLVSGHTAKLDYEPSPYDLDALPEAERPSARDMAAANQVVSSYLIFEREPVDLVPAPVLRVTSVSGGSSAEACGLRSGDYILSYGGQLVDSVDELTAAKAVVTAAGQATASIVIYRGPERLELEIKTGQMGVNLSAE